MPACDGERDEGVELVGGVAEGRGVHDADEFVTRLVAGVGGRGALVQQRSGAGGVEVSGVVKGVGVVGEVVDGLRDFRVEDAVSGFEGLVVVAIGLGGFAGRGDDGFGAQFVSGLRGSRGGHGHVARGGELGHWIVGGENAWAGAKNYGRCGGGEHEQAKTVHAYDSLPLLGRSHREMLRRADGRRFL